jgi:hypothetical protein
MLIRFARIGIGVSRNGASADRDKRAVQVRVTEVLSRDSVKVCRGPLVKRRLGITGVIKPSKKIVKRTVLQHENHNVLDFGKRTGGHEAP